MVDAALLGVNAIVGSSIFLFPGRLARMLGPASIAAFALTALLLAPVALCFAEASSRFDAHGGPYLYARAAFGPTAGYAIGWTCWVVEVLSLAAVADGVGLALSPFWPGLGTPAGFRALGVAVIAVMAAINARGVKWGARTSNLLTAAKVAPLLGLCAFGLWRLPVLRTMPFAPQGLRPLGPACFLIFFAFQGFEVVPVPAGEVGQARRRVPLAVVASLAAAAALFVAIQAAAVAAVPGLSFSPSPLSDVARVFWGPGGASLMAAAAAVSMLGFTAGCALGGPRYLAALGEQGDLPARAAALHPRFGTPAFAILLSAALSAVLAASLDFEKLVDVTNVVICAQYAATCLSVPRLRGRGEGWRLPGGPLIPLLGTGATLWLGSQASRGQLLSALAFVAAGFLLRGALSSRALKR